MKIAAIPNAHALAHVSRLLEIAKILRDRGHEIIFGGTGRYLSVAKDCGFLVENLPYITIEQILDSVRSKKLGNLYRMQEIEGFVEEEVAFLRRHNPDLVLLDNRPTARTAADLCNIRTASVLNVHMSSYRKLPFFSLGDFIPALECLDPVEIKIEQFFYDQIVTKDLNKLRKKLGLKKYYGNEHEEGDLSLLTDIPEFNPTSELPNSVHLIGPITWHNDLPEPICLSKLNESRKTLYFTLGSASLQEIINELGGLTQNNVQVVIAYGSHDETSSEINLPEHIYLEKFVNADKLLPYCDAVCCHGGNGTIYQALSHGKPIIAVATHGEQLIGARRLQNLGLGRATTLERVKRLGIESLFKEINSVLDSDEIRTRCNEFKQKLYSWNGAQNAADRIEFFGLN